MGRAARHIHGKAVLYGDKITPAMQATIHETNRRRAIQMKYNAEHGITPTPIKKEINTSALAGLYKDPEEEKRKLTEAIKAGWKNAEWQKMDAKKLEKDTISEDESKLLQEEIQKLTDKYIKKIDDLTELKSKDILTV